MIEGNLCFSLRESDWVIYFHAPYHTLSSASHYIQCQLVHPGCRHIGSVSVRWNVRGMFRQWNYTINSLYTGHQEIGHKLSYRWQKYKAYIVRKYNIIAWNIESRNRSQFDLSVTKIYRIMHSKKRDIYLKLQCNLWERLRQIFTIYFSTILAPPFLKVEI